MSVADVLRPVVRSWLGEEPPVRLLFWDGSSLGPEGGPFGGPYGATSTVAVRSPDALRRLIYAPNELGLGRAYVAGELDVQGSMFDALSLRDALAPPDRDADLSLGLSDRLRILRAAAAVGALGRPLPPPPQEARLSGRMHSRGRDADAIAHHYDVGNDFYRLILGETMTYSCAYFASDGMSLDDAQRAKYELICRKLGLESGMRLLDVGCGWGGMAMHAAQRYDVRAVGITLSRPQHDLAAKRVAEAGLADRVEIRLQDYRDVHDGPFDAISSIGMFEHVGLSQLGNYFADLSEVLVPGGRLLNHGISKPPGPSSFHRNSFVSRYVFPDGELHEVGSVVSEMQRRGFEVRDVESLREHYARTLRCWVANLESSWDRAVELAGTARARIWRLYMAASALGFEAGRINIHHVLGVRPGPAGASGMPPTRRW
ncbi:MAG: class I SAM-dependent methyltransferase [Actinomycetota bacterium]